MSRVALIVLNANTRCILSTAKWNHLHRLMSGAAADARMVRDALRLLDAGLHPDARASMQTYLLKSLLTGAGAEAPVPGWPRPRSRTAVVPTTARTVIDAAILSPASATRGRRPTAAVLRTPRASTDVIEPALLLLFGPRAGAENRTAPTITTPAVWAPRLLARHPEAIAWIDALLTLRVLFGTIYADSVIAAKRIDTADRVLSLAARFSSDTPLPLPPAPSASDPPSRRSVAVLALATRNSSLPSVAESLVASVLGDRGSAELVASAVAALRHESTAAAYAVLYVLHGGGATSTSSRMVGGSGAETPDWVIPPPIKAFLVDTERLLLRDGIISSSASSGRPPAVNADKIAAFVATHAMELSTLQRSLLQRLRTAPSSTPGGAVAAAAVADGATALVAPLMASFLGSRDALSRYVASGLTAAETAARKNVALLLAGLHSSVQPAANLDESAAAAASATGTAPVAADTAVAAARALVASKLRSKGARRPSPVYPPDAWTRLPALLGYGGALAESLVPPDLLAIGAGAVPRMSPSLVRYFALEVEGAMAMRSTTKQPKQQPTPSRPSVNEAALQSLSAMINVFRASAPSLLQPAPSTAATTIPGRSVVQPGLTTYVAESHSDSPVPDALGSKSASSGAIGEGTANSSGMEGISKVPASPRRNGAASTTTMTPIAAARGSKHPADGTSKASSASSVLAEVPVLSVADYSLRSHTGKLSGGSAGLAPATSPGAPRAASLHQQPSAAVPTASAPTTPRRLRRLLGDIDVLCTAAEKASIRADVEAVCALRAEWSRGRARGGAGPGFDVFRDERARALVAAVGEKLPLSVRFGLYATVFRHLGALTLEEFDAAVHVDGNAIPSSDAARNTTAVDTNTSVPTTVDLTARGAAEYADRLCLLLADTAFLRIRALLVAALPPVSTTAGADGAGVPQPRLLLALLRSAHGVFGPVALQLDADFGAFVGAGLLTPSVLDAARARKLLADSQTVASGGADAMRPGVYEHTSSSDDEGDAWWAAARSLDPNTDGTVIGSIDECRDRAVEPRVATDTIEIKHDDDRRSIPDTELQHGRQSAEPKKAAGGAVSLVNSSGTIASAVELFSPANARAMQRAVHETAAAAAALPPDFEPANALPSFLVPLRLSAVPLTRVALTPSALPVDGADDWRAWNTPAAISRKVFLWGLPLSVGQPAIVAAMSRCAQRSSNSSSPMEADVTSCIERVELWRERAQAAALKAALAERAQALKSGWQRARSGGAMRRRREAAASADAATKGVVSEKGIGDSTVGTVSDGQHELGRQVQVRESVGSASSRGVASGAATLVPSALLASALPTAMFSTGATSGRAMSTFATGGTLNVVSHLRHGIGRGVATVSASLRRRRDGNNATTITDDAAAVSNVSRRAPTSEEVPAAAAKGSMGATRVIKNKDQRSLKARHGPATRVTITEEVDVANADDDSSRSRMHKAAVTRSVPGSGSEGGGATYEAVERRRREAARTAPLHGFVYFTRPEDAAAVLAPDLRMFGVVLGREAVKTAPAATAVRLYVGNLPPGMPPQAVALSLSTLLQTAGYELLVRDQAHLRHGMLCRGDTLIEFPDHASAVTAAHALRGALIAPGHALVVAWAGSDEWRQARPRVPIYF